MAKPIDRRDLFKKFGSSALLFWPILNASRSTAADAERIKRAVFFFKASGVIKDQFFPTADGTNFSVTGTALEPLEKHLKDIQIFKGICLRSDESDYTGHNAPGVFLTGRGFASGGFPDGMSIDQVIAKRMTNPGFKSIQLGWQVVNGNQADGILSYAPAPMPAQTNPYAAFDSLFKELIDARCTASSVEASRLRLKRKSVLDGLTQNLRDAVRLEGFGTEEKVKLDSYAQTVRDLETNLAALTGTAGPDICLDAEQMRIQEGLAYNDWANIPAVSKIMMDLIVASLKFDRTRVVALTASNGGGPWTPSWLNGPDGKPIQDKFHELAHGVIFLLDPKDPRVGSPIPDADFKHNVVDRWYIEQYAYLIDQMKQVTEGAFNILDNSSVLMMSEMYNAGADHNNVPIPNILAGGGGGYFTPGKVQTVPNRTPHAKLLLSVAHSMGLTDLDTFGAPGLNVKGPLV